jgi:hypothetical protein
MVEFLWTSTLLSCNRLMSMRCAMFTLLSLPICMALCDRSAHARSSARACHRLVVSSMWKELAPLLVAQPAFPVRTVGNESKLASIQLDRVVVCLRFPFRQSTATNCPNRFFVRQLNLKPHAIMVFISIASDSAAGVHKLLGLTGLSQQMSHFLSRPARCHA